MFEPGAPPLVEVDTTGACASECCDEVVSSSSSEPQTHESAHAVTDSRETIPPLKKSHAPLGTLQRHRKCRQALA